MGCWLVYSQLMSFISHGTGGWKSEIRMLTSRLLTSHCIRSWEKGQGSFLVPLLKGHWYHSWVLCSHDTVISRRVHLLMPSHKAFGFRHLNFEGIQVFRLERLCGSVCRGQKPILKAIFHQVLVSSIPCVCFPNRQDTLHFSVKSSEGSTIQWTIYFKGFITKE